MTQDLFPEIQAAVKALENQITVTESEIVKMKESISEKRRLVRAWPKAVAAVNPKGASRKRGPYPFWLPPSAISRVSLARLNSAGIH